MKMSPYPYRQAVVHWKDAYAEDEASTREAIAKRPTYKASLTTGWLVRYDVTEGVVLAMDCDEETGDGIRTLFAIPRCCITKIEVADTMTSLFEEAGNAK
jgi:hypothetical protein